MLSLAGTVANVSWNRSAKSSAHEAVNIAAKNMKESVATEETKKSKKVQTEKAV